MMDIGTNPNHNGASNWANPAITATLRTILVFLVAMICGNVVLYSLATATPLIQADGWYFLDSFLSKYFSGTLSFSDFFAKRGGTDHAQPLQKLILIFHTYFFDMDFRVEGLIGTSLGIIWCGVIAWQLRAEKAASLQTHIASCLGILMVFLCGLSLNSTNIFSWPLVTLGYLSLLLSVGYFLLARHSWERPRPFALGLCTILLGLTIDSQAVVVLIAASIACWPLNTPRRNATWKLLVAALAGLFIARVLLWRLSSSDGATEVPAVNSTGFLAALSKPEAVNGLLSPLADSIIHLEHLVRIFPASPSKAMIICAVIMAILHTWFWIRTYWMWREDRYCRTAALAVFLMLMSYGMTAAIIIGRVPMFDWNYLHQPRYVLTYQICLIALAIMLYLTLRDARIRNFARAVEPAFALFIVFAIFSVQYVVGRASWELPHYLTPYWQNTASAMENLAVDPLTTPPKCPDIMSVCEYQPEDRKRLMNLMADRQLNIFSPRFQMRNRLYPSLESIPGFSKAQILEPVTTTAGDSKIDISFTDTERCVTAGKRVHVAITVNPSEAISDAELWVDAMGSQRLLLRELTSSRTPIKFESELSKTSHLTLISKKDGQVVAMSSVTVPECGSVH